MVSFTYSRVTGARAAAACDRVETTCEEFAGSLSDPDVRSRKDGAAIVLATFGDRHNNAGNLRWDGNVTAMTVSRSISISDLIAFLEKNRVARGG
jgi:hypothetical protein